MKFLVFDVGCIECGESSEVVGIYDERADAEVARSERAGNPGGGYFAGGQHEVEIFEIERGRPMTAPLPPGHTRRPAPPLTEAEAERVARFEAAPPAPESYDPTIWEALSELLPCHPEQDCTDECECTSGELRMAMERVILRERTHMADCEGDGCCDRSHRLAMHVDVLAMDR